LLTAVGAPNAGHGKLPEENRTQTDFSEPKGKANNASDAHVPEEKRTQTNFGEPKRKADSAPDTSLAHYPMNGNPHGYALIINNKNFVLPPSGKPKLSTRDGTDADRDCLALVLRQLGYRVMPHNDRSSAEIKQIIHEYADSHCRKEHDSFVCCILSHGTEGQVYGSDSQPVKIRDLSRKLAGCESLTGKPKIFFIQACQGTEAPDQVPKPDHDRDEDPDKDVAFLPRDSDLFIGYTTTPETVSLRCTTGTWYIQELCNVLGENKHDLVTMITQVHHAVATKPEYCYEFTSKDGKTHEYRQQPQMISTLRHQVKF